MYVSLTGWPADLQFLGIWKSQGILCHLKNVREFREICKSQGILTQNLEKSGNFTCAKRISLKLFQNSF